VSGFASGGAIYSEGALTVDTTKFIDNATTGTGPNAVVQAGAIFGAGFAGPDSLTVVNSLFKNNITSGWDAAGGAIQMCCGNSTLTVTGSTFDGNQAITAGNQANAGAIANGNGTTAVATITNSVFTNNSSVETGGTQASSGAILNRGTMTITGSTFSGNQLNSAHGGSGGAVSNCCADNGAAAMSISNSLFTGNKAISPLWADGGAVSTCCNAVTTIAGSTFSGNTVTSSSGMGGALSGGSTLSVSNSTLTGNSVVGMPLTLQTGANSQGFGGNISVNPLDGPGPAVTLNNDTITGGSAPTGPNISVGSGRSLVIGNTIVSGTPGGGCALAAQVVLTDKGHNLENGAVSTCGFSIAKGDVIGGDPKLGPLQNNGGPTPTLALLSGSAAIDKGDNALCSAAPVNSVDQRGLPRFPAGDATCDIGAFEVQPVVASTPTPTPTPTPRPTPTSAVKGVVSVPKTGGGPDNPGSLALVAGIAALCSCAAAEIARRVIRRRVRS
jgi:hypothetical protein